MTTERNDEITKARLQRRRRIRRRRLAILGGTLAGILALLLFASYYSATIPLDIRDGFRSVFSVGRFPADIGETEVSEYAVAGRSIVLLTPQRLQVLSGGGAKLMDEYHTMANVGLAAKGNRIAVYSRQGRTVRIYNRTVQLAAHNVEYPIISAAVTGSGKTAVLTQSEEYTCELHVYNKNTTLRFSWYGSHGFPLGVFAGDGDTAAVVTVQSEGGRLYSLVTLLDLAAQREKISYRAEGLVLGLVLDGDSAILILDERAVRFAPNGTEAGSYDYSGRQLLAVSHHEETIALAFGDNNRSEMNAVVVLNRKLAEEGTVEFKQPIYSMFLDSDRLHLLTRGSVYSYAHNGTLRESYDADISAYAVLDMGGPILLQPQSAMKLVKERKDNHS